VKEINMRQFFTLRYQLTNETIQATVVVVAYIIILGVMLTFVAPLSGSLAGSIITLTYLVMFAVALIFARRRGNFAAVGIARHRWLTASILGVLIGGLGLLGTMNCFPGGTFLIPTWPSLLALLTAGLSAGLMEDTVLYGYFQFRLEEAFGPLVAILGSALAWTLAHGAVLAMPGAGTFAAQCVGVRSFLVSLFITFFIIGLIVHFTRNIWAGVVQNAMMGNVLTNLYMLSIMPDEVFIANPDSLPVSLLVALLVLAGLAWVGYSLSRSRFSTEEAR